MNIFKSVLIGISIYLALFFGEKAIHFIYFYASHEFGTSNLLLIKSSLMLNFAPILSGLVAGYVSKKGLASGFLVGIISTLLILIYQQSSGANPFMQSFTPSILFDEIFVKSCICAVSGAAGELLKLRHHPNQ